MCAVRSPTWLGAAQICPKASAAHLAKETAGTVLVSPPLRAGTAPWAQPRSACGSAGRGMLLRSSFASLGEIITLHWLKNSLPLLTHPLPSFGSLPKAGREGSSGALVWSRLWGLLCQQRLPHSSIINGSQWRKKIKENGNTAFLNVHMIEAWSYQARKTHLTSECGSLCLTGWSVSLHGTAQAGLSLGCLLCCRQMCCCVPGRHACELGQLEINTAASSCWQQPGPFFQHLVLDHITLHFPTHPVREDMMREKELE